MKGSKKHSIAYRASSAGVWSGMRKNKLRSILGNAILANARNGRTSHPQASSSHFLYRRRSGRICPWISLMASPTPKETPRFMWAPKTIVCDRHPVFTSGLWKELFRLQGTRFNSLPPTNRWADGGGGIQTDGQTEVVVNRMLEMNIRCFTSHEPKDWTRVTTIPLYFFNGLESVRTCILGGECN